MQHRHKEYPIQNATIKNKSPFVGYRCMIAYL